MVVRNRLAFIVESLITISIQTLSHQRVGSAIPLPDVLEIIGDLPRRPGVLALHIGQDFKHRSLLRAVPERFATHCDGHGGLDESGLARRIGRCHAAQPQHDVAYLGVDAPLSRAGSGAHAWDVRVVDSQEDPREIQELHARDVDVGQEPDVWEGLAPGAVRLLVVDRAEGDGLAHLPLPLVLFQLVVPLHLAVAPGRLGSEAELEDPRAVVQVAVGPDEVFDFGEVVEDGPGGQRETDRALLHKGRSGFLTERDAA